MYATWKQKSRAFLSTFNYVVLLKKYDNPVTILLLKTQRWPRICTSYTIITASKQSKIKKFLWICIYPAFGWTQAFITTSLSVLLVLSYPFISPLLWHTLANKYKNTYCSNTWKDQRVKQKQGPNLVGMPSFWWGTNIPKQQNRNRLGKIPFCSTRILWDESRRRIL